MSGDAPPSFFMRNRKGTSWVYATTDQVNANDAKKRCGIRLGPIHVSESNDILSFQSSYRSVPSARDTGK